MTRFQRVPWLYTNMPQTAGLVRNLLLAFFLLFSQGTGEYETASTKRGHAPSGGGHEIGGKRPNIILIITDDQDLHMQSLDYMPYVRKHLINEGTSYRRHYCTTALCCPSRVSLLVCIGCKCLASVCPKDPMRSVNPADSFIVR